MHENPITLRLLRREKQLSQDEVAKQLGVSRQTIFAIETGRSEPSLSLALKICSLFDMAIEELFADEFDIKTNDQKENNIKEVTTMTPNLVPFSPLGDITNLHRDIDRFFEEALTAPKSSTLAAMNVRDAGDHFVVDIAIPGFREDEVDIEAGEDFLTVKGEKRIDNESDKKGYLKREFSHSSFERSVILPSDIQADKVKASIEHGMLSIELPKVEPTKPKVSKVKVSSK